MIYVAFLFFTLLILYIAFYQWQYFMIFTPTLHREGTLDGSFEILSITTPDGVELEGVVYKPSQTQEDKLQTLLFFAGRSHDSVALIKKLSENFPQHRVITFNYRSYGESGGVVSEKNLYKDALKVSEVVEKNYGEFSLLGFSLGASIATFIVSKRRVKALFLVGIFDSIALISKEKYGINLSWILRYKFDNIAMIKNVETPCYIFASCDDEITYIKNVRNFKKYVKNLATYMELEGLTHKELLWSDKVIKKINGVIDEA